MDYPDFSSVISGLEVTFTRWAFTEADQDLRFFYTASIQYGHNHPHITIPLNDPRQHF
ncbi:hypothetical protein ABHN03_01550 [Paenibacillus sp. NRS-1775]|uniref:hypothetical protein n=1 Tax=unclassified Paenibacillus TaxID=185978 RepID=UPI003D29E9ED